MGDTLSTVERSERMRRVRGKDTAPELLVRRMVHNDRAKMGDTLSSIERSERMRRVRGRTGPRTFGSTDGP